MGRSTFGSFGRSRPAMLLAEGAAISLAGMFLSIALLAEPGCRTSSPSRAPETFDDVYEQRASLRDSVITLTGRFMGWEGRDCAFPSYAAPQETRSDWIFRIGKTCLYVTGGRPPDLSPMEESSIGKQILLDARLRIAREERLLLEYVRSRPVSQ